MINQIMLSNTFMITIVIKKSLEEENSKKKAIVRVDSLSNHNGGGDCIGVACSAGNHKLLENRIGRNEGFFSLFSLVIPFWLVKFLLTFIFQC